METIKIMFVCHGNICRSPMAEFIMKEIVKSSYKYNYIIESRATSYEEIGNDIYYESKKILDKHNIKYQRREAKRITKKEYEEFDYIIVMDDNNIYNLNRIIGNDYFQYAYIGSNSHYIYHYNNLQIVLYTKGHLHLYQIP